MVLNPNGTVRPARAGERVIGIATNIKCKHCAMQRHHHAPNDKCLFESTTYANEVTVIIQTSDQSLSRFTTS